MICPKCGSEHVTTQAVTITKEQRKKRKGLLYWLFIGWWWEICMWILFGIFKLLHVMFRKRTEIVSEVKTVAVCQNCGNRWDVE